MGDEGGQSIVIPQSDLIRGHRVVFVDDGDNTHLQEAFEGALGIAIVRTTRHVIRGEKHLTDRKPLIGERSGILRQQNTLAHAGGGLLRGEVPGTTRESQERESRGDRAAGYEHHVTSRGNPITHHLHECLDATHVKATIGASQGR